MPNATGRALLRLRQAAWYSWGGKHAAVECVWCRRPLTFATMTLEHLVPKSRGGTDRLDNLAPACRPCNWSRGNKSTPPGRRPAAEPSRSRSW